MKLEIYQVMCKNVEGLNRLIGPPQKKSRINWIANDNICTCISIKIRTIYEIGLVCFSTVEKYQRSAK